MSGFQLFSFNTALRLLLAAGLFSSVTTAQQAGSKVKLFAVIPDKSAPDPANPSNMLRIGHPEGVTADRQGNVYAATFETSGVPNYIYVWDPNGQLIATVSFPEGRAPLGMVTDDQFLYVNDVLNGDIVRYTLPVTDSSTPERVWDICGGFLIAFGVGQGQFCALNANDLGPDGRLYISDNGAGPSFVFSENYRNGRIFVLDPRTGSSSVWFDGDSRGELNVSIADIPEFGVNGVAFSRDGGEFYMANMSTDAIYRMSVRNCQVACEPTALQEFVRGNGINGPDNIAFDSNGLLWVASGQNDRVVAINRSGLVVAKVGRFEGMTSDGTPMGLMQPSGIIVVGDRVFVGNEASRGLRPKPDLLPESVWNQLRRWTMSEISTSVVFQ